MDTKTLLEFSHMREEMKLRNLLGPGARRRGGHSKVTSGAKARHHSNAQPALRFLSRRPADSWRKRRVPHTPKPSDRYRLHVSDGRRQSLSASASIIRIGRQ